MLLFNKDCSRKADPFPLTPFAAERISSEMLSQYFVNRYLPQNEDDESKSNQENLRALTDNEILARLDKIDKSTVARVDLKKLIKQAPKWAQDILKYLKPLDKGGEIIEEATVEQQEKKRKSRGAPKKKNLKWMEVVFERFREIGLMEVFDRAEQKLKTHTQAHAVMFMVKKIGSLMEFNNEMVEKLRVITDAREANVKTSLVATYNIFTLDALLQNISNLYHATSKSQSKRWYCINADFAALVPPDQDSRTSSELVSIRMWKQNLSDENSSDGLVFISIVCPDHHMGFSSREIKSKSTFTFCQR